MSDEERLERLRLFNEQERAKFQAIETNLPSWSQVETYLDGVSNLTEAKAALKKIARVVYWLAKNKGD
jgi:hypothetical protein